MKFLKEFFFDYIVSITFGLVLSVFAAAFFSTSIFATTLIGILTFAITKYFTLKFIDVSLIDTIDILKCYILQKSHSMPWVKVENVDISIKKQGDLYLYVRTISISPVLKPMMHYVQHVNAMGRKIEFESISCSTKDIELHKVAFDSETLGEFQVLKFVMSRPLAPREKTSITISLKVESENFVPILGIHVDNYITGSAKLSVSLDHPPQAFIIEHQNGGQIARLSEFKNKTSSKDYSYTFENLKAKNRYRIRWG
jgi:hypothetical protein